jgi:hypothetical protein
MVMENVVFFGDSNTARSGFRNKFRDKYLVHMCASSGASPKKIMEYVYDFVSNDDFTELGYKKEETIFVIQYSFLSRLYIPRRVETPNEFDGQFHSPVFNPTEKLTMELSDQNINTFYNFFIQNFYDEELYFNQFCKDVDILNGYLDYNNINYVNHLWDSTCVIETFKSPTYEFLHNKMAKLKFIEFEKNQFLFGRIAERDKLRIFDEVGINDYHLSDIGNDVLYRHIKKVIEDYSKN